MNVEQNAKYMESHEWARKDGDVVVIGISDHAQDALSDVVFVELPSVGDTLAKGDVFGVVESVKAASDLYAPISGKVVEVNEALEDSPETINSDPFGAGWIIKISPSNPAEWDDLLTPEAYAAANA